MMAPQTRQIPKQRPTGVSIRPELSRIEAASTPWWAHAPAVFGRCIELAFAPLRWLTIACEAVVSVTFVAVGGGVYLWWTGHIPDAVVATFLGEIGDRMLGIVKSSGLIP